MPPPQGASSFFFCDDFLVLLDLVLEEAWVKVLQRSSLERAQAETVLWLTLSVVRGLASRSLWQPDPKRFRGLLDEWKALMSERWAGRSRNGKRAGRGVPMPTGRRP